MKDCRSALPIAGALPTSAGSVTGSMPNSRNDRPSIWIRPSSTGETGQPAQVDEERGKLAPLRATSMAVRGAAAAAARS